jgi:four helix bundle protein
MRRAIKKLRGGEMKEIESFEDLNVWKEAVDVADLSYEVTEMFPKHILWGIGTQMQRSSTSVGSNIAEGCERQHTAEYIQFCHIALGSLAELYTQLTIAKRRKYVTEEKSGQLFLRIGNVRRMLKNLLKSLKLRKKLITSEERQERAKNKNVRRIRTCKDKT